MTRVAIASLLLGVLGAPLAAAQRPSPLVLVLDASGSMWGEVRGEAKIVGAKRVIAGLADGLPDATPLALVAYGHRREGDCADIETLLPLATLDRAAVRSTVEKLTPKGKTPITAALEQALGLAPPGATVVVVTDGLETCGGDPCAAVRGARERGAEFVLHVVGLDVEKEDVSSLECAAQAGGGLYLPAPDAAALAAALDAAVAMPVDAPAGALVVGAKRNGALQDLAVRITPLDGSAELGARTYGRPETNPRTIPLADGRYRVRAHAVGVDGAVERELEVTIAAGGRVEHHFDFSTGELRIGATRNGALSDVRYELFVPGDRKRAAAQGRTYRAAASNPAKIVVPAGEYDVVLHALELGGNPALELGRVSVLPSGDAAIAHDFPSGDLLVGVVRGAALVDATLSVRRAGKAIEAGRTYKSPSSNPKRFTLAPGDYEVEISEIRGERRTIRATITAGGELTRTVDLATAAE